MEITSDTTSPAHASTLEEKFKHLKFPKFHHEKHKPVVNVNELHNSSLTFGDRTSDSVASYVGSWRFVILMTSLLIVWLVWNSISFLPHFDPAPFILLNLCLSFLAGYTAPFIMMSQNRQATKDRLTAENDYKTDVKGEQEICHVLEHLDHQDGLILQIAQRLEAQNKRIDEQEQLILQIVQKMDTQQESMKEQHQEILRLLSSPSQESQE
ncbi:MAG TPA: DUF1003 domain-containing protein [Ktedonobacteraceae bacterium]|jgi:uncharacterized membrane protein|nr:DUF1003 domain-containing protein [Ktedonobacteraceae bacterium]